MAASRSTRTYMQCLPTVLRPSALCMIRFSLARPGIRALRCLWPFDSHLISDIFTPHLNEPWVHGIQHGSSRVPHGTPLESSIACLPSRLVRPMAACLTGRLESSASSRLRKYHQGRESSYRQPVALRTLLSYRPKVQGFFYASPQCWVQKGTSLRRHGLFPLTTFMLD